MLSVRKQATISAPLQVSPERAELAEKVEKLKAYKAYREQLQAALDAAVAQATTINGQLRAAEAELQEIKESAGDRAIAALLTGQAVTLDASKAAQAVVAEANEAIDVLRTATADLKKRLAEQATTIDQAEQSTRKAASAVIGAEIDVSKLVAHADRCHTQLFIAYSVLHWLVHEGGVDVSATPLGDVVRKRVQSSGLFASLDRKLDLVRAVNALMEDPAAKVPETGHLIGEPL